MDAALALAQQRLAGGGRGCSTLAPAAGGGGGEGKGASEPIEWFGGTLDVETGVFVPAGGYKDHAHAVRRKAPPAAVEVAGGVVQQVRGATEWAEALRSAEAVLVGFTAPWCQLRGWLPRSRRRRRRPPLAARGAVDAESRRWRSAAVTAVPLAQLWVRGAKVREVRGADADAVRELVREGEEKVAASSA